MSCCCNYVKKQNNFLIVTPDDFTKASRGCCRACQRLGGVRIQQLLRVTQYDVNGLDSRRRCVKSVNYGLIIFALSCFVGDALSRASPPPPTPYEACRLHTTPQHSSLLAWIHRAVDSAQLNRLQLRRRFGVRPPARRSLPGRCCPLLLEAVTPPPARHDLPFLPFCRNSLNGIRGWPEVSTATGHPLPLFL